MTASKYYSGITLDFIDSLYKEADSHLDNNNYDDTISSNSNFTTLLLIDQLRFLLAQDFLTISKTEDHNLILHYDIQHDNPALKFLFQYKLIEMILHANALYADNHEPKADNTEAKIVTFLDTVIITHLHQDLMTALNI